ncbi:MAG: hypothetical protein C0392_10350 [Syntrophus sp. (in: bacteria)]|nr:hypothetical protein [Syntrophus sp. (in: bacteria)]
MNTIAEIYTESVHKMLRPLFANWEPYNPLELGDYGIMDGNTFIRIGNIKDFNVSFNVREDMSKGKKNLSIKDLAEVKLHHARGSAALEGAINTKAQLEINFLSEEAVFFNAADCQFRMIRDKALVGRKIMQKYRTGEWERPWAVVTDVVRARTTTVAVSGGKDSSIVFEAQSGIDLIDPEDASIGLRVAGQKNVGYVVDGQTWLFPLMGLSKIQSTFLWFSDEYNPLFMASGPRMLSAMRNSPKIRTEETSDDLYFGQIK